ncbi:unnamed protein product, partial [Wuchereria bancrofti]
MRDNPHITKEEWDLLRSVDIKASNSLTPLLPKIEDVCTVRSYSSLISSSIQKDCFTLPLQVFEAIHLCTYNPDFIGTYCRLSLFIEHFSTYIQYEQRNSLLEKDINVYADVLSKLDEFRHRLESSWKSVRWVGDVASIARDKRTKGVVSMKLSNGMNDEVRHNGQGTTSYKQVTSTSQDPSTSLFHTLQDSMDLNTSYFDFSNMWPQSVILSTNSLTGPWFHNCSQPKKTPTARVIKVHAAYRCGLTCSVRLQIAPTTTASEIVALVTE